MTSESPTMTEPATPADQHNGRIPFRLRVGVTGHRTLQDEDALAARVREALDRVRQLAPSSPYTSLRIGVVSPLAEGADRLVAREAIDDEGATLEVPLPLPVEDYRTDFTSEESQRQFDELLAEARVITILPPSEKRDEAYESVGEYVVDRCDLLIALWDGNPARGHGGTAEIVARTRSRGLPLLWIHTEPPYEITEELGRGISVDSFERVDHYNRSQLDSAQLGATVQREVQQYSSAAEQAGLGAAMVRPYLSWIWSYFARADALAVRFQSTYVRFSVAQFLLGAAAVVAVAIQTLFFPEHPEFVWIEVLLMLSLLGILLFSRRARPHERWISHRYLAERFRTAFFLALADVGGSRELSSDRIYVGSQGEEWMERAFDEVWSERPRAISTDLHLNELKRFLGVHWILDQLKYHQRVSERNERKHHQLTNLSAVLFGITLFAAILHALGVGAPDPSDHGEHSVWSIHNLLIFLAISLPALGGAIGGIHAQREYHRNAERFGRMVPYLEAAHRRLERATDAERLRVVVDDVGDLLLDEIRDWFVVMRFHDIELHV